VPTLFLPVQGRGFIDPATGAVRLANVLLPVDGSTPSGAATSLALRLAEVLGVGMSVAVHLLHVGKAEEAAGGAAEATHDSRLRVIAKDGSSVTASVLDTAAEVDADLIVMATRGRDGLLDALLGTTTEQVLHQAGRALLAVPVA
jgi:nucleotide-binding universal stress UspA family protein